MSPILIYFLCLLSVFSNRQSKQRLNGKASLNQVPYSMDDSADIYISRLNCNSVIVTATYVEQLLLDEAGQRLVGLEDKNLNTRLLSYIDDTSKALALHIILTNRLEPKKSGFGEEYVYDKDQRNVVRVNYRCNDFHCII